MNWNKRAQKCSICTEIIFLKMLCTNAFTFQLKGFLLCQDNLSTWQVWHIKKLNKQVHLVLGIFLSHNATDVSS